MDNDTYKAFKQQLANGGAQAVTVPQLFETPPALAARMVERANIQHGNHILEPSAGRGALLTAIEAARIPVRVSALELNAQLAAHLADTFHAVRVAQGDFLKVCSTHKFDRIIMNPPFINATDIKHIMHAASMLSPGGRLVALCADGPRQRIALQPLASSWESLPAGTFADAGTMVNVALVVINV